MGGPGSERDVSLATGKGVILELEVEGAFAVRRRRPDATLVFVCPPSFEDLERRLRARATDSAGEIEVRLAIAHEQLRERDQFDIVITNDDAERATRELQQRLELLAANAAARLLSAAARAAEWSSRPDSTSKR